MNRPFESKALAIHGNFQADRAPHDERGAARRTLNLDVVGETATATGNVTLLNLSTTGVLLRTPEKLRLGERVRLSFPDRHRVTATVVWTGEGLFGCRFETPVSQATVSAASLRSPFAQPAAAPQPPKPETEETSFGDRLKRLRTQRGLSLQALAGQVGVSKPALWKWERGDVRPRPAALARLAEVLGLSPAELVFGGESGQPRGTAEAASLRTILNTAKTQAAGLLGVERDAIVVTVSIRD